jgi:hypothetical protein
LNSRWEWHESSTQGGGQGRAAVRPTIFWDVNFSSVQNVFDAEGSLLEKAFLRRIDKFLKELIWMASTLRYGRRSVALG